jgi:hypothetical protein
MYPCLKPEVIGITACYIHDITGNLHAVGHIVVQVLGDVIIEPSYEIFKKNPRYVKKSHKILNIIDELAPATKQMKIQIINNHLDFIKIGNRINKGEFFVASYEYYNKQADFIEMMSKKNGLVKS